jgi:ribonuclease PH
MERPTTRKLEGMSMAIERGDSRKPNELRRVTIERGYVSAAPGSVLISAGRTAVMCTASVEGKVPAWRAGSGKGWITAEYAMLPGSTNPRKARERGGNLDSRSAEIQRLIGRSLRAVADLQALGEETITVDCDVLRADGGTRTLSITGALVALVDAIRTITRPDPTRYPLLDSVAAVSAGIVGGHALLDLSYEEDVSAAVDLNVVMTGTGRFVELQGTGEESTFSDAELAALLELARGAIHQLTASQRTALGPDWPWPA